MLEKRQKGEGAVWIILIIAIIALIALWISKNPLPVSTTTAPTSTESGKPEITATLTPTPTKSLLEIEQSLKDLNTQSKAIDQGLNDTPLDINQ
jgi:hypothetical protein